jgi:hypothetical protein
MISDNDEQSKSISNRKKKVYEYSLLLKKNREKLITLGRFLSHQYSINRTIEEAVLQEWLQINSVLNMYKVCNAFYRGSLFYGGDLYHPACRKKIDKKYLSFSTVSQLDPVVYANSDERTLVYESYLVSDSCNNPSQIIKELLFSYTHVDCTSSISIARYLTLLDLLRVVHGKEVGTRYFDTLFSAKSHDEHNFNRLRIGIMDITDTGNWYDFSPLYYFHSIEDGLTFEHIRKQSAAYIGAKIFIQGHPEYLKKHPRGMSQGWNVIMIGMTNTSELLFLAANEIGKKCIYTYKELMSMLAFNYNIFPHPRNIFYDKSCKVAEVGNFTGCSTTFNLTAINKMLTDFDGCVNELKQFCDDYYRSKIVNNRYKSISFRPHPLYACFPVIKKTIDDQGYLGLGFFKPSSRKDIPCNHTVDDHQLNFEINKI